MSDTQYALFDELRKEWNQRTWYGKLRAPFEVSLGVIFLAFLALVLLFMHYAKAIWEGLYHDSSSGPLYRVYRDEEGDG